MAVPTCASLVRELGTRMGEYALATAAGTGTTQQLVDQGLTQYFPATQTTQFNAWVYGVQTTTGSVVACDASNRAVERRAMAWNPTTSTLTLAGAGMPAAMLSGNYEVRTRHARSRMLEAINDAIRQLHLSWYRPVVSDGVLQTAQGTWQYTLPAGILWGVIKRVEIQVNTGGSFVGYPYADASPWNWRVEPQTTPTGTAWILQFGTLPPPGRNIRIYGDAGYLDLSLESDVLPLPDQWHEALGWIYDWAEAMLYQWEANRQPAGQVDRLRQAQIDRLQKARQTLLDNAPPRRNLAMAVPGRGDGQYSGSPTGADWAYLGAFSTPGL